MKPFESPFSQRVVDPTTPAGALDQARLTQHLQVVAEQVAWDRRRGLQVTHAPRPADQDMEQLQPDRIRYRRQQRRTSYQRFSAS
jgi:hypothetical protein